MERISRFRAMIIILLFTLVLAFFVYTMYDLQIIETGGVIDNTTTYTTITRVKAARGDIIYVKFKRYIFVTIIFLMREH